MGNYQEHLKKINPLREVDSGSVRTQLFGNPFKLERTTDNKVIVSPLHFLVDSGVYDVRELLFTVHHPSFSRLGISVAQPFAIFIGWDCLSRH